MRRARATGSGGVFTPTDFLGAASRAAVDQALSRLVKSGKLRRLTRGLYDYPKVHPKLGALSPAPDDVARALAREPGGATAFAALLSGKYAPVAGEKVCVLVCGANTSAVLFGEGRDP